MEVIIKLVVFFIILSVQQLIVPWNVCGFMQNKTVWTNGQYRNFLKEKCLVDPLILSPKLSWIRRERKKSEHE